MFGYVKPVHNELLVKEYEFYRAAYCGICRAMKKHTGGLSSISLSYDSVFLCMVRMLFLKDSDFAVRRGRCIVHPIKSRPMLCENPAIEYTARAFAILAYYKALDDISDEGVGKKIAVGCARPVLKRGARKARQPDISAVIAEKLSAITALEKSRCKSVDEGAILFGELLGCVFSHGLSASDRLVTYQCGFHLGKFIYAIDSLLKKM